MHLRHGCPWEGKRQALDAIHRAACPFEAIKGFFVLNDQRLEAEAQKNRELQREVTRLQEEVELLRSRPPPTSPSDTLWSPAMMEQAFNRMHSVVADTNHIGNQVMDLTAGLLALETRQDLALLNTTSRLREEMYAVRAMCQGVQSQLLNFVLDRRKESLTLASGSTASSVLNSAIGALTGDGGSKGSSSNTSGTASGPTRPKLTTSTSAVGSNSSTKL
ncbi:hypothetical protein HKX48_007206 [Thoreauomyces humboldtii]|nr:hypothetical protein HKX48_007206 [Thoreauomyces humboldtii]